MSEPVKYVIEFGGNGVPYLSKLSGELDIATVKTNKFCTFAQKLTFVSLAFNAVQKAVGSVKNTIASLEQAYQAANVAETKLQQVMQNTIGATSEQIQSIKDLASEQQKLGVVSKDVQIAGAQELATYVSKTETLKKILPAMNDMIAQQYGINASQEQATQIATMLGKVMNGETGALKRYGYEFSAAQKKILETGTEAQRAKVLFEVVTEAVGGVNKALAETPEGRMVQIANEMGEVKERFGKFITVTKNAFFPLYETIMQKLNKIADWFDRNQGYISYVVTEIARVISSVVNGIGSSILWIRDFTLRAFARIKEAIEDVGEFFSWLWEKIRSLYPIIISVITVMGAWYIKTKLLTRAKYILMWQTQLLAQSINRLKNNIIKATVAMWGQITSIASWIPIALSWGTIVWALTIAMGALKSAINKVSLAIYSIPIIGWIAAGIALIIGIFKLLWEKSEGFRRIVFGVWEVVKMVFGYIWQFVKVVFGFLYDIIKGYILFWFNVYKAIWEFLKKLGQGIADFFISIWNGIVSFFKMVFDPIKAFFAWLFELFPKIGAFIKKAFQPLLDFFNNLWDTVKNIFSWILDKMAAIFNPIIQLWNKLTGKVVEAYEIGAEKGSESWRKSQEEKGYGKTGKGKIGGIDDPSISGTAVLDDNKTTNSVTKNAEATATGGTRSTTINIHMGKFFDNIVFNGGFAENAKDVERKIEECLLRVLYSAQNAG